ncbi:MAG: septum formation initiator family protein [Thermodesulfovibrionales bacterium]|nr:septum formation initiator family protein [Thermodesulfovibrionales bacterium]
MNSDNLLRKQVVSEIKKKRLITFILIILSFIYLAANLLLGDAGLLKYRELSNKKLSLKKEITELEKENTRIKTQIKSLKENPFYTEKYAREEFGLARPDEYIFQYDR